MLAAVPVDTDICLPRIILGGAHPHAELTAHAAALDAGRTDLLAVYSALRFPVVYSFKF